MLSQDHKRSGHLIIRRAGGSGRRRSARPGRRRAASPGSGTAGGVVPGGVERPRRHRAVGGAQDVEQPAAHLPVGAGELLHPPRRPVVRRAAGQPPGAGRRGPGRPRSAASRPRRPARPAPSPRPRTGPPGPGRPGRARRRRPGPRRGRCRPPPGRAPAGPPPGARWCRRPAAACRSRSRRPPGRCRCRRPGSASSAATSRGTTPPCRSTIATRRLAQPQRPPRVAELAPRPDDLGRRGRREVGRRRPARQPLPPHRLHPGHRRLLQHHLADQHRPGVDAGTPPRQVARGRRRTSRGSPRRSASLGQRREEGRCGPREPSLPRPVRRRAEPGAAAAARARVPGVLHPVGKLPARVYWRRRRVLLGLLLSSCGGGGWIGWAAPPVGCRCTPTAAAGPRRPRRARAPSVLPSLAATRPLVPPPPRRRRRRAADGAAAGSRGGRHHPARWPRPPVAGRRAPTT